VVKEFRCADVESTVALPTGFLSQGTNQESFADSCGAGDDDVLVLLDPIAREETHQGGFIDAPWGFVIDVFDTGVNLEFSW